VGKGIRGLRNSKIEVRKKTQGGRRKRILFYQQKINPVSKLIRFKKMSFKNILTVFCVFASF